MSPLFKLAQPLQAAFNFKRILCAFKVDSLGPLALAAAALWMSASAHALPLEPALEAQIQAHVLGLMQSHPLMRADPGNLDKAADTINPLGPIGRKAHVTVGAIDPRLRLAPCAHIEPYLPSGYQLSGRSRIGLRCLKGPTAWRISLPVHIQVLGRGWIALNDIRPGSVLSVQDFALGDIDLFADAAAPVVDLKALQGRITSRALGAGDAIRQTHLKPKQWFSAGDSVRVLAAGKGFAVTGLGQALTPGIEGQPAKVKMEAGRVVSGTAVAERQMTLDL